MSLLVALESHPVQYHAPVYRALSRELGGSVHVVYGSDFSVRGYHDAEFERSFMWDTDLLSGYDSSFLSHSDGTHSYERVGARGLRATLRRLRPSAVLLAGYASRFDKSALVATLVAGLPSLLRAETTDHARERTRLAAAVRRTLLSGIYRRFHRLLFIGARSKEHYLSMGVPEARLEFSPYCVDKVSLDGAERQQARAAKRAIVGAHADDKVVVFCGKLSRRKGVDLLPPALAALNPGRRNRTVLLIVGDGEERAALESALTAGKIRHHFAGFQNQSALPSWYAAADALVLPSRSDETWGLVVNEALQNGLPVVASEAVGCVPDLVRTSRTGCSASTGDVSSTAQALEIVLQMTNRSEVADACRALESAYSVSAAAAGIANAYRSLSSG